jgi:hypothetical protein
MSRENGTQNEKGQNRVKLQFYPGTIVAQTKRFCKPYFTKFHEAGASPRRQGFCAMAQEVRAFDPYFG